MSFVISYLIIFSLMEEWKNITLMAEQQNNMLLQDVCFIIEHGCQQAYANVRQIAISTYWKQTQNGTGNITHTEG